MYKIIKWDTQYGYPTFATLQTWHTMHILSSFNSQRMCMMSLVCKMCITISNTLPYSLLDKRM